MSRINCNGHPEEKYRQKEISKVESSAKSRPQPISSKKKIEGEASVST